MNLCVQPAASVKDAITCIDRNQRGIVLVVDATGRLLDTITDGDIRRALLAGQNLEQPVAVLMQYKAHRVGGPPISAIIGTERAVLLRLMREHSIRQIPLVHDDGTVASLVTLDELVPAEPLRLQAVIVAGGVGSRLRPLTHDTPKPLLPVGGRPLMERTVDLLRQAGIRKVSVTTCYQQDKIREHFGDGRSFGVEFSYVRETVPLGTAGGLALVEASDDPLLIINGDILTRLDVRAMLDYHLDQGADLTIAVRKYEVNVPYGVVEGVGADVRRIVEKPNYGFFVNAGIYLLRPAMRDYLLHAELLQMTELIQRLIEADRTVVKFPVREYWLDIGEPLQYEQAQQDLKQGWLT